MVSRMQYHLAALEDLSLAFNGQGKLNININLQFKSQIVTPVSTELDFLYNANEMRVVFDVLLCVSMFVTPSRCNYCIDLTNGDR